MPHDPEDPQSEDAPGSEDDRSGSRAPDPDEATHAGDPDGDREPPDGGERRRGRGRRVGSPGLSSAVPDRPTDRDRDREEHRSDDPPDADAAPAGGPRASSAAPSVSSPRRPRRDFLADVHEELAEHRRQLRETTGHTAEALGLLSDALPRVDDLTRTVDTLAGRVDYLLERIDQPRDDAGDDPGDDQVDQPGSDHQADTATDGSGQDAEPAGDGDAPAGRRPRLAERHVPARIARDHGLIGPVNAGCWPLLGVDAAAAEWEALALFIARVLHPYYQPTRGQLPDCWPAHPRCVVELAWLHRMYQGSALKQASPAAMAEWHTRWLPAALDTLAAATASCRPGHHHDPTTDPADEPADEPAHDQDNDPTTGPPGRAARSGTTGAGRASGGTALGPMATRSPVPNAHTPRPDADYLTRDPRRSPISGHPGERTAWQPDPRERRAGGPPPTPSSIDEAAGPAAAPDPAAAQPSDPSFWLAHYRRAAVADLEHRAAIGHHARHEPENREFAVTRADPAAGP